MMKGTEMKGETKLMFKEDRQTDLHISDFDNQTNIKKKKSKL